MRIKVAKQVFSYLRCLLCCCKYDPELKDTAPRSSGDGENDHDILLNIVADDSSHVAWNPPNPVDEKLSRSVSNGHASGQNDVASVAPDTMESCTSSPGIEMKHKALPNPPVVVGQVWISILSIERTEPDQVNLAILAHAAFGGGCEEHARSSRDGREQRGHK